MTSFKRLNDRYGHDTGDLCLKRLPSILVAELGAASEGAVRYGGEEFLVVLPEMQLADAMRIAERIRRSVGDHPERRAWPIRRRHGEFRRRLGFRRRTHGGGVDFRRRYRSLSDEAQGPKPSVAAACSAE
jgi:GGDEF domain-containing protein